MNMNCSVSGCIKKAWEAGLCRSHYVKKQKERIIQKLGGKCKICGSKENLHIHHRIKTLRGEGRGRFERLCDWKRNLNNLELLCKECHMKVEFRNHVHTPIEYKPNRFRCITCGRFIKA